METTELRKTCKGVLKDYIEKDKHVRIIDTQILKKILEKKPHNIEETYKQLIITVCCKIQSGIPLKDVLQTIKTGKVSWDCDEMEEYKHKLQEQDEFLEKPFEIEDGVIECNKCGSKRTYSYTKQTRSGDEATTVFSVCAKCGAKWKT